MVRESMCSKFRYLAAFVICALCACLLSIFMSQYAYADFVTIDGIEYNIYYSVDEDDPEYNLGICAPYAAIYSCDENIKGEVQIPETIIYGNDQIPVNVIQVGAFSDCPQLAKIKIPKRILEMPTWFYDSPNLTEIEVDPDNPKYSSENGVLFNKEKTYLYSFPAGSKLKNYTVPNSVKSIGYRAFYGCSNLEAVTILNGVEYVGGSSFQGCTSLKTLALPSNLKNIGDCAFRNCRSLISVSIPSSITRIDNNTFLACSKLQSVTLPNTITSIGLGAFAGCFELSQINIPAAVSYVGSYAFYKCYKLTDLSFPAGVYVGKYAYPTDIDLNTTVFEDDPGYPVKTPTYIEKQPATCDTPGSKACYLLSGKYYEDAKCTKEIKDINTWKVIPATGHSYKTTTTKATIKKNGKTITKCTTCGAVKTNNTLYKISSVRLSTNTYVYDGKVKNPSVIVKDAKGSTLKKNVDYTVSIPKDRKNVGVYTYTITFKGNYSGTQKITLTINPKAAKLTSLAAGKRALTAKWTKLTAKMGTKTVTGYEVRYATKKNMSDAKTKVVNGYKSGSLSISGLKAKTTYYVQVRSYMKIGANKYCSAWSSTLSKKTK